MTSPDFPAQNSTPAVASKPASGFRPILLGIGVFIVCNFLLTALVTFSPLNKKFNFNYGNYLPTKLTMLKAQHPEALDVLFLGTSQTNNGFIPSIFENALHQNGITPPLNSFNLGLPNNRYDIMQACLETQVHQYKKPKLVLLELGPSIQERNSYFYYLPALYYRSLIENDPARGIHFLSNPLLAYNVKKEFFLSALSSLYQYRFTFSPINLLGKVGDKAQTIGQKLHLTPLETVSLGGGDPSDEETKPGLIPASTFNVTEAMTAKGWFPKERSPHMTSPAGVTESIEAAKQYYLSHLEGIHFDKLEMLIQYCQSEHIPLALVMWPQHPRFNQAFRESRFSTPYFTGIHRISARYHVPVIDLNTELPANLDPSQAGFFADPRHMIPEGAAFMTEHLARRLSALPEVRHAF